MLSIHVTVWDDSDSSADQEILVPAPRRSRSSDRSPSIAIRSAPYPKLVLAGTWETHADATIDALQVDAPGRVPWWPRPDVQLFNVMVHVLTETQAAPAAVSVPDEG